MLTDGQFAKARAREARQPSLRPRPRTLPVLDLLCVAHAPVRLREGAEVHRTSIPAIGVLLTAWEEREGA